MEYILIGKSYKNLEGITKGKNYQIINDEFIDKNMNDLNGCVVIVENDFGTSSCYDAENFELFYKLSDDDTESMEKAKKQYNSKKLRKIVNDSNMTTNLKQYTDLLKTAYNDITKKSGIPSNTAFFDTMMKDGVNYITNFDISKGIGFAANTPNLFSKWDIVSYDKIKGECIISSIYNNWVSVITDEGKLIGLIKTSKLKFIKHANDDECTKFYDLAFERIKNRYEKNNSGDSVVSDLDAFKEIQRLMNIDIDLNSGIELDIDTIDSFSKLFNIIPKDESITYTDELVESLSNLYKNLYNIMRLINEGNEDHNALLDEAVNLVKYYGIDVSTNESLIKARIYMISVYQSLMDLLIKYLED